MERDREDVHHDITPLLDKLDDQEIKAFANNFINLLDGNIQIDLISDNLIEKNTKWQSVPGNKASY